MGENSKSGKIPQIAVALLLIAAVAFAVFSSYKNAPYLYGGAGSKTESGEVLNTQPGYEYTLTGTCDSTSIVGLAIHFGSPGIGEVNAVISVDGHSAGEVNIDASEIKTDALTRLVLSERTECAPDTVFEAKITYNGAASDAPSIAIEKDRIAARYEVIWDSIGGLTMGLLTGGLIIIAGIAVLLTVMRGYYEPEQRFLVLYVITGLCLLVALPLYRSPDEYAQFARVLEICRGQFISPVKTLAPEALSLGNADLSSTTQRFVFARANIDLGWNDLDYAFFPNTSYFFPTAFIPHVILTSIVHLFTDRLIPILYAARLGNFIGCGIILWLAIRIMPYGKDLTTAVSLFPMSLQGFISSSADGFSFALFILFLAFILRAKNDKHRLSLAEIIALYAVTLLFSLSKTAYTPLCLLLFLIPQQCFGKKRDYWMNVVILGSLLVAINLVWVIHASSYPKLVETVDTAAQINWILGNPVEYAYVIFNTLIDKGLSYLNQMLGVWLGWVNIGLPAYLMWIIGASAICIAFRDNNERLRIGESVFVIILCCITLLATMSAIYLQFNETANGIVIGYQGRYLLPLIVPAVLAVKRTKRGYTDNRLAFGIIGVADALCAALVLLQTI